jgi:hypothetical protein
MAVYFPAQNIEAIRMLVGHQILKAPTNVHPCRLLPLPVQPRRRISVALRRGPIPVQAILIQVRLKERGELSLNRGQGFAMGCGNPAVKTWIH